MTNRWETHWDKLSMQSGSVLEIVAKLVATAGREHSEENGNLEPLQSLAERLKQALEAAHSGSKADWKDWVEAETTWLELRFALRGLLANPSPLRATFVASVRDQVSRLEAEIASMLDRSDRFRPRTRVAISQEVQRLQRRLDVLRDEATHLEESGPDVAPPVIRSLEQSLPSAGWEIVETKRRFSRPRGRQGRELAPA